MPNLIGTAPNQVPTNGLLGGMAFQSNEAVNITGGRIEGVTQGDLQYPLVNQGDIGTEPNQIPLNSMLGEMSGMDRNEFAVLPQASVTPNGVGEMVFQLTNNTTLVVKVKGSDGTVRSATLTLA
jgi:hypothetical protein